MSTPEIDATCDHAAGLNVDTQYVHWPTSHGDPGPLVRVERSFSCGTCSRGLAHLAVDVESSTGQLHVYSPAGWRRWRDHIVRGCERITVVDMTITGEITL